MPTHATECCRKEVPLGLAHGAQVEAVHETLPLVVVSARAARHLVRESGAAQVTTVETAVNAAPGPVVLIGHSLGGVIISRVAEEEPQHIAKLIFVAGFVPKDGDSALGLAMTDPDSLLGKGALNVNKDQGIGDVDPKRLVDVFCADCSTAEQAELQAHYRTEPIAPLATPVHITAANWGSVAKYYVYTKQDHAISYPAQQAQTAQVTFVKTALLDSSHSPFLAKPNALVSALLTF